MNRLRRREGMRLGVLLVSLAAGCGRHAPPSRPADAAAPATWTAGICGTGDDSWCWGYPRPIGAKLSRLWGSGPRDVWAVGDLGTIIHFDGERWSRVSSGTTDELVAIGGRGPGDAWAIGKNRTLLRLSGGAWKSVALPKIDNEELLSDLLVLPNGDAWIVGGMTKTSLVGEELINLCFVGHHDGTAWRFDEDEGCGPLGRVWGAAPDNVWADGGDVVHWNGRYLTKNPKQKPAPIVGRHGFASGWKLAREWGGGDGGQLKDPRGNAAAIGGVRDFWAAGPEDVWAIAANGALAHFDGQRWSQGDEPLSLRAVAARAADDVWAVGAPSTLLHFDGHDWRSWRLPGSSSNYPIAVAALAARPSIDVWVLTSGELLHFDGKRWTSVASKPPKRDMFALFARAPEDVWVGAGIQLLHWNGHAIETFDLDFEPRHLWGTERTLWAGDRLHRWDGAKMIIPPDAAGTDGKGFYGTSVAIGSDGLWLVAGSRWLSRVASGKFENIKEAPQPLQAVWASPSGEIWAAGYGHVTHGKGETWTVERTPGLAEITAIGGADGLVWMLGREGLLFRR